MSMSPSYLRPFAFETVEVADGVIATLDADVFLDKNAGGKPNPQPAREATVSTEDQPIRFRIDGGDPDQDTGHYVPAGTFFSVTTATAIANFKAVAIGSEVTATIQVTYFNS